MGSNFLTINSRKLLHRITDSLTSSGATIHSSSVCSCNNNLGFTSSSGRTPLRVDKKQIEKLFHLLDEVIVLCSQPYLDLKRSPPCILDILPEIKRHIFLILRNSVEDCLMRGLPIDGDELLCVTFETPPLDMELREDENTSASSSCTLQLFPSVWQSLSENDYFCIIAQTLFDKALVACQLFKDSKERIFHEYSSSRAKLTRLSLTFSHILKDLEALFPGGVYGIEEFTITKPDAAHWWHTQFGKDTAIVPWHTFRRRFFETHCPEEGPTQPMALLKTIDLTGNYYVSVFEFDVFVRLFQPWNHILETWKALAIAHPAYMAFRTYDEVKLKLSMYVDHPGPGTYIYRLSCTKLGQWAIGYISQTGFILQTIVQNKSLAQALLDGQREGFYLYPKGLSSRLCPDLEALVHHLPQVRITITQEQYEVYYEMGSTFQLCKICTERDKDIRIDPCGHLLCRSCLISWQQSNSEETSTSSTSASTVHFHNQHSNNLQSHLAHHSSIHHQQQIFRQYTCPFCRTPIKSIEEITISPHQPSLQRQSSAPSTSNECSGNSHTFMENEESNSHKSAPPRPPRPPYLRNNTSAAICLHAPNDSVTCNSTDGSTLSWNYIHLKPTESPATEEVGMNSRHVNDRLDTESVDSENFHQNILTLLPHCPNHSQRVAHRLLTITRNDLDMALEILQYFTPKSDI